MDVSTQRKRQGLFGVLQTAKQALKIPATTTGWHAIAHGCQNVQVTLQQDT